VLDEDGDGTLELIGYYYAYNLTRANHIGEIRAVFKMSKYGELALCSSEFLPDDHLAVAQVLSSQPYVVGEGIITFDDTLTIRYPVLGGMEGAQTINEVLPVAVMEQFDGIKGDLDTLHFKSILSVDNAYVIMDSQRHISILFLLKLNGDGVMQFGTTAEATETVCFTVTFEKATGNRMSALSLLNVNDAFTKSVWQMMQQDVLYMDGFDVFKRYSEEQVADMIDNCDSPTGLLKSYVFEDYVALILSSPYGEYMMYFRQ